MDYRNLGQTGVKVSPLCLGAMMFGAWGNPDHDDCIRIIHRALDAGINFIDTANNYSEGESEMIVGKALADRRDEGGARHQGLGARWATGPEPARPVAQGHPGAGRAQPAPPRHRRHRPLPDPPPRSARRRSRRRSPP